MMKNLLAALLLLLPLAAHAYDATESGHAKMLLVSIQTKVADDFSYDSDVEIKYKALSEEGARQDGKFPISYNRTLTSVEILQAETVKADGRRIPVPEAAIVHQSGSIGLYTSKDQETISLAWPDYAAGDSVYLHYRTRNKPMFPGYLSMDSHAIESLVYDKVEVILDLPAKLVLQQDMQGYVQNRNEVKGDRRIMAWGYSSTSTRDPEKRSADYRQTQPHLWLSSFASWSEVAKAGLDQYTPQSAVTPEIEKLAKELTAGAVSEKEKAQRIYNWVRKDIRYIAIWAGLESWVPHKASDVLASHFGDCKDHTVLMMALLRAVGIDSVPALIQSDYETFQLTRVPMPTAFNHVINYLPSLDLYLDSTSVYSEFGSLPLSDQGKLVVRGKLANTVADTPISKITENKAKRLTRTLLSSKGDAEITTIIQVGAGFYDWFEQFHASIGKDKENAWARQKMEEMKRRGRALMLFMPDENGLKSFRIHQSVENYLSDSEIGLQDFEALESGPATITWVTDLFETEQRSGSFACYPTEIEDTTEITLPDNIKLLRLPRDREINSGAVTFKVSYSSDGNKHTMKRLFRWNPPNPGSCSAQEWQKWLKPVREVRSAVKSAMLVYERN